MHFERYCLGLVTASLMSACGTGLIDKSYQGQEFITVQGRVLNTESIHSQATVSVALLWANMSQLSPEGQFFWQVAQEVDLAAQFPATFELTIRQLPPVEVVSAVDQVFSNQEPEGSVKLSVATIIVYDDINGNGQLDIFDEGAGALPGDPEIPPLPAGPQDIILGSSEREGIFYVEGGEIVFGELTLTPGFHLVSQQEGPQPGLYHDCYMQYQCEQSWESDQCYAELELCLDQKQEGLVNQFFQLPPDQALEIYLRPDPMLSYAICQGPPMDNQHTGGRGRIPAYLFDFESLPDEAYIYCEPDNQSFFYDYCTAHEVDYCQPYARCSSAVVFLEDGQPQPTQWPCDEPI